MRALVFFSAWFVALVQLQADSYLFTLEQKVAASTAIVRVSVTEAVPPLTKDLLDPAVCRANVLEMLKGSNDLRAVEFRFHPYGRYSRDKLPQMVGNEFIVFLHEPPMHTGGALQSWVFEGPRGIRPIAEQYEEYRISTDKKIVSETLSHSNFVAAIRTFVAKSDSRRQ